MDWDGPDLAVLKRRAKAQLRGRMRAQRSALPPRALAERSARVVARLLGLPEFGAAGRIALFWPLLDRGEVDLRAVNGELRARGADVYYPFLRGEVRGFGRVTEDSELADAGHGFAEPGPLAPEVAPGALDVVVVPALAVSEDGHRLGYGSGFYDSVLPRFCPPAIAVAVAFDFQLLAELPVDTWDVPVHFVVTDARTLRSER